MRGKKARQFRKLAADVATADFGYIGSSTGTRQLVRGCMRWHYQRLKEQ